MDGFIRTVKVALIRTKQKVREELVPKRMLRENAKRKNEKIYAILEFLESYSCGVDDQISKDNGKNCIPPRWIFDSSDI